MKVLSFTAVLEAQLVTCEEILTTRWGLVVEQVELTTNTTKMIARAHLYHHLIMELANQANTKLRIRF